MKSSDFSYIYRGLINHMQTYG